jgi:GntR family transcriptional regulator, N-acetylglucosamine utilization regulator
MRIGRLPETLGEFDEAGRPERPGRAFGQVLRPDADGELRAGPQRAGRQRQRGTTLGRAIAGLVEEGVLVHRHGAGTFVRRNPPHVEQPLSRLTSFIEDMRLRGLAASSKAIEGGTFLPTPEESMMLDIALTEPVFRLARLRLADGVPMAIERAAVPLRFFGRAEPGGDSLYAALERARFRPVRAIQRLRAVVVGAAEAELLGIAEGAPGLDIHRVAYAADGRRVEFARSDSNHFMAELTLSSGARARTEGAAR